MIKTTLKRQILKSISYRILGALVTFTIIATFVNFFTALSLAAIVSLSDQLIKIFVYYFHEKLWDCTKYGLELDTKKGACVWLTGLPCSGKTTIAIELIEQLEKRLHRTEYLDGDIVRRSICSDLGFSKDDRDENIKRITLVSSYLAQRAITVCAFVSPYKAARDKARKMIPNFVEVSVDCPIDVCINRDIKGMYAKALAGQIKGFTGVDDPYENPEKPEVVCQTNKETVKESVEKVIKFLEQSRYI